jgi:very-short-patch-repair endonuclease
VLRSRASAEKKAFAKSLRRNPTATFENLWQQLRRSKLGVRFRRRSILLGWMPDFWCPAARVAIEIDYPSDDARVEDHRRRDRVLTRNAITVLRFPAERVQLNPEQVAREIELVVSGILSDARNASSLKHTYER